MAELVPMPLKDDLKVRRQTIKGEVYFIVKDPEKDSYYRFDEAQFEMLSLFDGTHSIEWLIERFNASNDEYEFDNETAIELYSSVRGFGLIKKTRHEENIALVERLKEERKKRLLQRKGSLLFMRFKLVDPDRFFNRIIHRISFMWEPHAVRLTIFFMLLCGCIVLFFNDRFVHDFKAVYLEAHKGVLHYLGIWLIALVIIAFHECGHGLTCKRFGGEVHEMGFLLLAFQPCLYCNVNDAWLFENKAHKLYVALAGVYMELLIGALGVIVWLFIDVDNPIGRIAFVAMTIATSYSLILNLNPLMKFDGYYILSDLLDVPNLRVNAISWFSWLLKRHVLRLNAPPPVYPSERERRIFTIYGGLMLLYLSGVLTGVAVLGYTVVASMFGFWGIMAFFYLAQKALRRITGTWPETLKNCFYERCIMGTKKWLTALMALCLVFGAVWITLPSMVASSGHIEMMTLPIYAPENGFIKDVGYNEARKIAVSNDMPILKLYSPMLNDALFETSQEKMLIRLSIKKALSERKVSEAQRLKKEFFFIEEKEKELKKRLNSLNIRLPEGIDVDNVLIIASPPYLLINRYVKKGEHIMDVARRGLCEVKTFIDQRDIMLIKEGDELIARAAGGWGVFKGRVSSISPVVRDGIEQGVWIRGTLFSCPDIEVASDVVIKGKNMPIWRHIVRYIRRITRSEIWM